MKNFKFRAWIFALLITLSIYAIRAGADAPYYPYTTIANVLGMGTGGNTFLATPSSANLIAFLTDEVSTGTGKAVFASGFSGNSGTLGQTSGVLTSGHCVDVDASGNLIDAGAACNTGTVTTSGSPSSGQMAVFSSSTAITGSALGTGVQTFLTTPSAANFNSMMTGPVSASTGGSGVASPAAHSILVAEGSSAFNVLAVGLNNQFLVGGNTGADPTWLTPWPTFKNILRNGIMQIAQRGTSGTVTAGNTNYTLDGWMVGVTGATISWSQQAPLTTSTPGVYNMLLTGATSMTDTLIKQRVEGIDAGNINGMPSTFQIAWFNNTGNTVTPTLTIKHAGTLDNWGSPVTDVNAVNLQACAASTECTEAYTYTASTSSYLGLEVTVDFGSAFNSGAKSASISQADWRIDQLSTSTGLPYLNASPPRYAVPNVAEELVRNQRYYVSFGNLAGPIGNGAATSTTAFGMLINLPVPMRIAPTGITVTTVGDLEIKSYAAANVIAATGLSFSAATPNSLFVTGTVASTIVAGTPYYLNANTALINNIQVTGSEL